MANMKRKLGAALGALALMIGAVPGTVGLASAYGVDGQILDRGRFPRTIHIVAMLTVAAIVGAILVSRGNDTPASP